MTKEEKRRKQYAVNGDALYARYRSEAPGANGTPSLASMYKQITTRPAFRYDVSQDPLYQQYRDRYVQQGKLAMKDTMGQAAALTGGYGSSYGQAAGQQAYDRYMQGLSDKVPELYSAAYGRYQDAGDRLVQQYGLLRDQDTTAYERYRDALGDAVRDQQFNYQIGRDVVADDRYAAELEYQKERDTVADERYAQQFEYQQARDAIEDERAAAATERDIQQDNYKLLYSMILTYGYTPTKEELAAAGMSDAVANTLRADYLRRNPPATASDSGKSGGGGGGGYYGGGGGTSGGSGGTSKGTENNSNMIDEYLQYLTDMGYSKSSQIYQTIAAQKDSANDGGTGGKKKKIFGSGKGGGR